MKILIIVAVLIAILVGIMYFFPQINFREMPKGLENGQLPEEKPNWVSSLVATNNSHYIAPLKINSLEKLSACINTKIPEIKLTQITTTSLIGYRQSPVFHFVDWFSINHKGMVVSTATMGRSDFGKNRQLIEKIRALCA